MTFCFFDKENPVFSGYAPHCTHIRIPRSAHISAFFTLSFNICIFVCKKRISNFIINIILLLKKLNHRSPGNTHNYCSAPAHCQKSLIANNIHSDDSVLFFQLFAGRVLYILRFVQVLSLSDRFTINFVSLEICAHLFSNFWIFPHIGTGSSDIGQPLPPVPQAVTDRSCALEIPWKTSHAIPPYEDPRLSMPVSGKSTSVPAPRMAETQLLKNPLYTDSLQLQDAYGNHFPYLPANRISPVCQAPLPEFRFSSKSLEKHHSKIPVNFLIRRSANILASWLPVSPISASLYSPRYISMSPTLLQHHSSYSAALLPDKSQLPNSRSHFSKKLQCQRMLKISFSSKRLSRFFSSLESILL